MAKKSDRILILEERTLKLQEQNTALVNILSKQQRRIELLEEMLRSHEKNEYAHQL